VALPVRKCTAGKLWERRTVPREQHSCAPIKGYLQGSRYPCCHGSPCISAPECSAILSGPDTGPARHEHCTVLRAIGQIIQNILASCRLLSLSTLTVLPHLCNCILRLEPEAIPSSAGIPAFLLLCANLGPPAVFGLLCLGLQDCRRAALRIFAPPMAPLQIIASFSNKLRRFYTDTTSQ